MNKLVRDKIPQLMMNQGMTVTIRKELDEDNCIALLHEKFDEEVQEFKNCQCLEEAADVLEVMCALLDCTLEDISDILLKKRAQKGRFLEYYVMEFDNERV